MQSVTKSYIYTMLERIQQNENKDISKYVAQLIGSEAIPYEVVVFVNTYIPLDQLTTYNAIYAKRNNSRLFRNIVKDDLSVEDKAIVLSSILNQLMISVKHDKAIDRESLVNAVNIDLILDALHSYMYESSSEAVEECFEMFRTIFKTLFPKK